MASNGINLEPTGKLTPELEKLLQTATQEKAVQLARRNTKIIYGAGILVLAALVHFVGDPIAFNIIPHFVAAQDLYTTGNAIYDMVDAGAPIGLGIAGGVLEVATMPNMRGIRRANTSIRDINALRK